MRRKNRPKWSSEPSKRRRNRPRRAAAASLRRLLRDKKTRWKRKKRIRSRRSTKIVRVVGVVYICYRQLFFSLFPEERERETISFFPIICCSLSVKSLALFFWSKRFKPTMELIRVHDVKFFLKKLRATRCVNTDNNIPLSFFLSLRSNRVRLCPRPRVREPRVGDGNRRRNPERDGRDFAAQRSRHVRERRLY